MYIVLFVALALATTVLSPALAADGTGVPAKPEELAVHTEQSSLDVSLSWDEVNGASEYLVRWRVSGPGHELNEGIRVESSSAAITVADYGGWVVRVQACNDAGCGRALAQKFEVAPAPEPTATPERPSTTERRAGPTPEPTPEAATAPLQVSISASATVVPVAEAVLLTATITDPPADAQPSYQWELKLGDWYSAGTAQTLSILTSVAESNTFRLTVTYNTGATATSDLLTITWVELPAVPENLEVFSTPGELDVSATWDAVEGASSYRMRWRMVGSNFQPGDELKVESTSATTAVRGFGEWEVHLAACNDGGCGDSAVRGLALAQQQQIPPTADAGPDQEALTGATVTLGGSGSSSISGATLTYAWTQTGGVNVTLDDTTAQMPSFTVPSVRTDLEFTLVVNDGTNPSVPDTVTVVVRPPLNPTSVPCAHPSEGAYTPDNRLVTVTETTNSTIGFRGVGGSGSSHNDLWFCWPDGTSVKRADNVDNLHVHTESRLNSGTRYWVLVLWWDEFDIDWTDWVAVTTTGGASIRGARFTSSPASGDTYRIGEVIQAQITWSQPVTVNHGGDNANVSLRLDVGADDADLSNSRRKMVWTGEGSGTDTLTFAYKVQQPDKDADGVWLQTASATDNTVVFLQNGATITGGNPANSTAVRTRAGLPTTGGASRKVGLTSRKLVGKNHQTHGNFTGYFTADFGQPFTTGDDEYKLTSVAIRMSSTAASAPAYTVSIHENSGSATSSRPAGRLAMLQKPASALGAEGMYSFGAPDGGIDLRANTTYWVVIDVSSGTDQSLVYQTFSGNQDTGSMVGWSIAHGLLLRDRDQTEWEEYPSSLRLDVYGYAKPKAASE